MHLQRNDNGNGFRWAVLKSMKGNTIIKLGAVIWVVLLVSTFFIKNEYINAFIFFFGAMAVVSIFAVGCDKLEKNKEKLKVPKWLEGIF